MKTLTRQEMFDRAWTGLKTQGWRQAKFADPVPIGPIGEEPTPDGSIFSSLANCSYYVATPDGSVLRCAWGHVDPEGTVVSRTVGGRVHTVTRIGSIRDLAHARCGIAASLSTDDLDFVSDLQRAHDFPEPYSLQDSMRGFAAEYRLTIPEEG